MKTKFILKGLQFGAIKIDEVQTEIDFSVREANGMKDVMIGTFEKILNKAPQYLEQVAVATKKYDKLSEEISDQIYTRKTEEFVQAINTALSLGEAEDIAIIAYENLPFKYHNLISMTLKEIRNKPLDE